MGKGLIIFDFDGTLGDTRRNIVTTMQMTIAELHLPKRSEEECAATIGLPLAGCFRKLFPDIQMGANAGTKTCGVTWGNGTKEELENAGATFVIDRIENLIEIVNKGICKNI